VRRIRPVSAGLSPAIFGRMSAAVALSAALHVFLIYGFSLPAGSIAGGHLIVINARLQAAQSPDGSRQRIKGAERKVGNDVSRVTAVVDALAPTVSEGLSPALLEEPVRSAPEPPISGDRNETSSITPDPIHYSAKDLDLFPQVTTPLVPSYPQAAFEEHTGGSVTMLVLIDETGRVVETWVMDATPEGIFEQAALQAVGHAAFYPAQKDGRAVRSKILVKLEFNPGPAVAQ